MDIISYGIASKAAKALKETKNILGDGVEGSHPHVQSRLDTLETAIQGVVSQADKLIVNDAVNIAKAHAKLNAVAQTKKYRMHNMVFDDLLDLSGIDTQKSSGYVHDAIEGALSAGESCIIETKEEVTDSVPSKVILTVEEQFSQIGDKISIMMTSNTNPFPYAVSASTSHSNYPPYYAFSGSISDHGWVTAYGNSTGWLQIDLGLNNSKAVGSYKIAPRYGALASTQSPKNWTFEGSNDMTSWTILDTQENIIGWSMGVEKTFVFSNQQKYRFYRLNVSKNTGDANVLGIAELTLFESVNLAGTFGYMYISRDNGTTWEPITTETLFYFKDSISPLDNKLRLKAEIPSGTKLLNYSLTWA